MLALLIAYPLAYAIAFKAGAWQTVLLFVVIAPFFTTYLIRTIAWKTILADESPVVDVLRTIGLVADDGRVLATRRGRDRGAHLQLPAVHDPADLRQPRADRPAADRGGARTSTRRRAGLPRVTLPLTAPGIVAGTLLTFIPAFGDYINAEFLGGTGQAMIGNMIQSLYLDERDYPEAAALSFVMMAVILVVGPDLHPVRRVRGAHGRRRGGAPDASAWAGCGATRS